MFNILFDYKKLVMNSFAEVASGGGDNPEVKKDNSEVDKALNELKTQEAANKKREELAGDILSPEEQEKLKSLNIEIWKIQKELDWKEAWLSVIWNREKILSKKFDSEVSDNEKIEDPEALQVMDEILELKRRLHQLKEEKNHLLRVIEVWKNNELTSQEIDIMKELNSSEFLKTPAEKRLRFVTKWNIDSQSVKDWDVTNLEFTFTYWNKFNKELYILTTAWQVLPENVRSVNVWWEDYLRKWINWEFFNKAWRRLTIHEWTNININEFWDIEELYKDFENGLEEFKDTPNYELAYEAKKKWYDPKFVVLWLWEHINDKKNKVEIEELLTDIARLENEFNATYPKDDWNLETGKISDKFAWYLLNWFNAKEETFKSVAKEFKFDPKVLKETKSNNDIWWGTIKDMEEINIEGVTNEEIQRVLNMNRFNPRSKETQILFRVALQAAWLPEEWYKSPWLHSILERESAWKVGALNYTINRMEQTEFKRRALANPRNTNPIWAKSTASWLWQLLLSNVDKYYPDWRNGIWNPLSEAVGFVRYIVDRYWTPEIAWSVYGKIWYYDHPKKWRLHKWFKEWY